MSEVFHSCLYCKSRDLEPLVGNMYRCRACGQIMDDFEVLTGKLPEQPEEKRPFPSPDPEIRFPTGG